jgi:hypothetical protein
MVLKSCARHTAVPWFGKSDGLVGKIFLLVVEVVIAFGVVAGDQIDVPPIDPPMLAWFG